MSEYIENPFRDIWEDFDINEFKKKVCKTIDKISENASSDDVEDLFEEIDDMFMSYLIVIKLKNVESIEVIKLNDLPPHIVEELGFDEDDLIDGYIPRSLIPREYIEEVNEYLGKQEVKKKSKNKWLIE